MTDSENGAEQARKREIAAQAVDPCVTNAVALFWADEGEAIDVQTAYDAIQAQNQCRATLDKLAGIATRPSETNDERPPIMRIVREIVYPPVRRPEDDAEGENAKKPETNYWRPTVKQASGWTAERRAKHSAAIRRWKPWEGSTGPQTIEGKARSSRNAVGNGCRQRLDAELAEIEGAMQAMAEIAAEL